ncbi:MAG TPA: formylglycine-generating enzyme family protein [Bdellovibrionales bacterium]|nr:formylglycine-generating enzyme family protein [Bdellovibrionales bacterium]
MKAATLALFAWLGLTLPAAGSEWIAVRGGRYKPLFTESEADPKGLFSLKQNAKRAPKDVEVAGFLIGRDLVTNAQFLKFTKKNPDWRRDRVKPIFADQGYLRHWRSAVDAGPKKRLAEPVVNVSWFASNAYCEWAGGRLPATDEWEYLASLDDASARDAAILSWYAKPAGEPLPSGPTFIGKSGARDMYGKVWEWTSDFNSSMVTGESREDTGLSRSMFCGAGSIGATNPSDYATFMRFAFRTSLKGNYALPALGFRCAKDLETP